MDLGPLISSRHNSRYLALTSIGRKGLWEQAFWCEGFRLCRAALSSGARPLALILAERFPLAQPERLAELQQLLPADCDAMLLENSLFDRLAETESPQGVALLLARPDEEELQSRQPDQRVLVLDRLQDPGNAGTLLRSAAAFGFSQVLTVPDTVDLWSGKVLRAALGVSFALKINRCASIAAAYDWLHRGGSTILCADLGGEALEAIEPGPASLAVVLGNEGNGVSQAARDGADKVVTIRMSDAVESLNVAVAGSILLHHFQI